MLVLLLFFISGATAAYYTAECVAALMSERKDGIGNSLSDAEMRFITEFQAQFIPFPIKDVL